MEELKKAKKIIEKSKNINLLPSPCFFKDSLPATFSLFYSLKKLGKNVNLLVDSLPEKFNFLFLLKKENIRFPGANFLISIKEVGTKLSHLFYEKTEKGINLYLKANGKELKKEDVVFQSLNQKEELVITIGITKFKELEKALSEKAEFLINIDNQIENENFGQINLIEFSSPSFSEIVFNLIFALGEKLFDRKIATCLLTGIVQATSNFQSPKLTSQTFQKTSFLIEKGAKLEEIRNFLWQEPDELSLRIFGRILTKINFSPKQNFSWVLLNQNDFQETNSFPKKLSFALEKINSQFFPFRHFLCLWESRCSPLKIKGVFCSKERISREIILKKFSGRQRGNVVFFQAQQTSLENIKEKVIEILNNY